MTPAAPIAPLAQDVPDPHPTDQPPPLDSARDLPREADKARINSFTDNVISIALTLLVLDLRLPAGLSSLTFHAAACLLWPKMASFLLSFAIVGVCWVGHHLMFASFNRVSQRTLWINNLFLLGVSLLPASAAILGAYPGQRVSVVLYGLNLLIVCAGLLSIQLDAVWHHQRYQLPITDTSIRTGMVRISAGIGFATLGIALAWVNPWISYALYWVAPLGFAVMQFVL